MPLKMINFVYGLIPAITYGDILTVLPFGNRVDSFELQGIHIWNAMERSVTEINKIHTNLDYMLHISGLIKKSYQQQHQQKKNCNK